MSNDKGAHYYKCDFQVHTPRDEQWTGTPCETEEERKAYAAQFVAACRKKGLQAVAITDHHDLVLYPYIREASEAETDDILGIQLSPEQRLVVFPGIELTLGIPCQAILLLDADFPLDKFPTVLSALAVNPAPATESKTAKVVRLTHIASFTDLYARLNEHLELRGRFIVLPHVQDKGLGTLLRPGFDVHYKSMPCVGGYTDGAVSKLGTGNQRIVSGKDINYGNKKIAVIQTSDARNESFAELGSFPTWIKWAIPTAEAIRQACLSDKSRISVTEPVYPKARILSVTVSDSVFLGAVSLDLNSQYNALIGGRGTGKSSMLEYIRWGLCDQPVKVLEEDAGDIPNYAAKRKLLIEGTLKAKNAVVTLECELNGVKHLIRRNAKTGQIDLKVGEGDWVVSTEQEINDTFPIQAYSQKQLSSVGVIPDEIERLATSEVSGEIEVIATDIKLLADSIKHQWAQDQSLATLTAEITRGKSQLASERAQIEALRGTLKGLSSEDQQLLAKAGIYTQQQTALDLLLRIREDFLARIEGIKTETDSLLDKLPDIKDLPNKTSLEVISSQIKDNVASLAKALAKQLEEAGKKSPAQEAISTAADAVLKAQKDFKDKYSAAKARSTSHQSSLLELERLERVTQALETSLKTKAEQLAALGSPATELEASWKRWIELHRKRSEIIKAQCEKLHGLSGGKFRAQAKACGDPEPIKASLEACFAGMNIKRAEEKVDGVAKAITDSADPLTEWFKLVDELQSMHLMKDLGRLADTPILEKALLSRANRENLQAGLTAERILEMRLTSLTDKPQFDFKIGPDTYITFAEASSGQQATSLLNVLLNQDGPPLLIDQPEEDLDNEVIQEIAMAIWETKSKRQLLFVSHNANIVVNGDAELVVCFRDNDPLKGPSARIEALGAIDVPAVKDSITRVMEGGDKAFELRRQKYGF